MALTIFLAACSSGNGAGDDGGLDATTTHPDASTMDATSQDAGPSDSGTADAGQDATTTDLDAGNDVDAGSTEIDAGSEADGGPVPEDGGSELPDGGTCSRMETDPTFIGHTCTSVDDCPATGYSCDDHPGIRRDLRCEIDCASDCDCPTDYTCQRFCMKFGCHDWCRLTAP